MSSLWLVAANSPSPDTVSPKGLLLCASAATAADRASIEDRGVFNALRWKGDEGKAIFSFEMSCSKAVARDSVRSELCKQDIRALIVKADALF